MSEPQCFCDHPLWETVLTYDAPPVGEMPYKTENYKRSFLRCKQCQHMVGRREFSYSLEYGGDYVEATYGSRLADTFARIMALPPERSDNAGRVLRVDRFARTFLNPERPRTLIDIGSGLAVFPARMRELGWQIAVVDPDPRQAAHAERVAQAKAYTQDFFKFVPEERYALVTFNKVLEHVVDPLAMLSRAKDVVDSRGIVYVELPDGPMALKEGPGREEFFIEHEHAFSPESLCQLIHKAGFELLRLERLKEPSSKYTLAAFMRPAA